MYTPSSTYRIQFNNQYTFKNLVDQLQYLTTLGIGAIYSSPVFGAVPGSNHGYDVTNPHIFNKEIGSEEEFQGISSYLKSRNIGWIQDIVPNHMAFHPDNEWLMDVLEKGRLSAYATYFDIDWDHPHFNGKVMVPILGDNLIQTAHNGEIKLEWNYGCFSINYYNFKLPVSGESFHAILEKYKTLEGSYYVGQGIANEEYKSDPAFRGFGWSNSRERFQAIYESDNSFEVLIDRICEEVNSNSNKLLEVLSMQNYVLTDWQDVEKNLNYRRFFTINGLISLRMEKHQVFDDYHSFITEKVNAGQFRGLRIDHIDGLKCPTQYFERLRAKMGDETYIVVEKILEHEEELHKHWPLQGSSGYDFLAIVNNLFTNQNNYSELTAFYDKTTGNNHDAEEIIYHKKKHILEHSFNADWENLTRLILSSGLIEPSEKINAKTIHAAIGEILINCPVYKLYSHNIPIENEDLEVWKKIIEKAKRRAPELSTTLNTLNQIFVSEYSDHQKRAFALEIFLKLMQYTGPVMAKGLEDTAMYTYSAFIAHNEVGDAINASGLSIADFHKRMIDRRNHYPLSINATATHDTKRGEDSRARLNVLSDLSSQWIQIANAWINKSLAFKTTLNGKLAPDINEEYFIYQTVLGALPMNGAVDEMLLERLGEYLKKALREAKINSNWNNPDEAYENAVFNFVKKLMSSDLLSVAEFKEKLITGGIINSLSQVVLKCTCPGIPDFYQGTELWDLSLVDPDNRRAVDYKTREELLTNLKSSALDAKDFLSDLIKTQKNGAIKLWISHQLMQERLKNPEFFTSADYLPLDVKGEFKNQILAFARHLGKEWYLTLVPLHTSLLQNNHTQFDWKDTIIELPETAPKNWKLLWNGESLDFKNHFLVKDALQFNCPAVYKSEVEPNGRGSGILLHITALPGSFGTGDLGEEAYRFIDFLKNSNQTYWQILPFNPVGASFSPYSSSSAFAGNTNFINPDFLQKNQLIENIPGPISEANHADFKKVQNIREAILKEAFNQYVNHSSPLLQKRFESFCKKENYWLRDYALFNILKREFDDQSWDNWPQPFKTRDKKSLALYEAKFAADINAIKFSQYLFSEQFGQLKKYANSNGVKIIGDMPIYVSYDSCDVWTNPTLFNLDANLKMKTVAGVPPDYFSETGQLWNMPIYNWETMKEDSYSWWKKRIMKNLEYCDMLRFDHFRGFASYWEVPATEKTAINGSWKKGPGEHFFAELKKQFPQMPFIAEDLGDINDEVFQLRDKFNLPGMKVLQFAFGENMPQSIHSPHLHTANSIVYTGTHDNNTIKGWFKNETDKNVKSQISEYLNRKVKSTDIPGEFMRLALSSVARIAIIPMQDILGLDQESRFNNPSFPDGNWTWKLKKNDLTPQHAQILKKLTTLYGR